jgi:hypothetical protein
VNYSRDISIEVAGDDLLVVLYSWPSMFSSKFNTNKESRNIIFITSTFIQVSEVIDVYFSFINISKLGTDCKKGENKKRIDCLQRKAC